MFEIEYELRIEDLVHFNELRLANNQQIQKNIRNKRFLVPAVMLFFGLFYYLSYNDSATTVYITVLAIIWAIVTPIFLKMDMRRQIRNSYTKKEKEDLLGIHKLVIEPEFLREKAPGGKSQTPWSQMLRIEELKDYIYIFTEIDEAIIIPKETVKSGDLKKFAKQTESMIERLAV